MAASDKRWKGYLGCEPDPGERAGIRYMRAHELTRQAPDKSVSRRR